MLGATGFPTELLERMLESTAAARPAIPRMKHSQKERF
jgi:hypothetical protein